MSPSLITRRCKRTSTRSCSSIKNTLLSRIHTVVVCALTTTLTQADVPRNVLLEMGEANLPQQSAVVVSKVLALPKAQLGD